MNPAKLQFDEYLGGDQVLPQDFKISKIVTARAQEIVALTEAIDDPQRTGLVFQRIPKHMRRRIMSHNVKRLPKRLREAQQSQLEKCGSLNERSKRPSRKYRRKPSNLLQEYNRRQKLYVWLETHIWHAKRFHMTEKWGYKIPNFPNDKSFRACYRAVSNHCLIQDISYYVCIELQGLQEHIISGLKRLTSTDCGLTFSAKYTTSGKREGKVVLFKNGMYPMGVIGSVTFLWRPEVINNERTLWLWSHPAFYSEVLQELISVFNFKQDENETSMDIDYTNKELENLKNRHFVLKAPKYKSKDNVKMVLLENTLNRFRLTGPLSQAVITNAFHTPNLDKLRTETSDETNKSKWVLDCYSSEHMLECFKEQKEFWTDMKSVSRPSELPSHLVLPLTIEDPRLHMPNQKIKAVHDIDVETKSIFNIPENLSKGSPLWDNSWRYKATTNMLSTAELNNLRSQSLVPGLSDNEVDRCGATKVSYLPIMLIHRPGVDNGDKIRGYGSGWDVILPAGWAMPVWLSLIFRGARAGGLRDVEHHVLEAGIQPDLFPDSSSGEVEATAWKDTATKQYFRLPPNKRPNFIKLGILTPFHCPWQTLIQDWLSKSPKVCDRFYVLRSVQKLHLLTSTMETRNLGNISKINELLSDDDKELSLLPVSVKPCRRGTLCKCAVICVPTTADLHMYKQDKRSRGPVECSHEDPNAETRKEMRSAHLAKLKKLRKKRIKMRKESEKSSNKVSNKHSTEEVIKEQAENMQNLWLPNEVPSVKESSSRSVLGFVTNGEFTFSEASMYGQGFIATSALLCNLKQLLNSDNLVLVRVVNSQQYCFAKMKICIP